MDKPLEEKQARRSECGLQCAARTAQCRLNRGFHPPLREPSIVPAASAVLQSKTREAPRNCKLKEYFVNFTHDATPHAGGLAFVGTGRAVRWRSR